jgi:glucokinase
MTTNILLVASMMIAPLCLGNQYEMKEYLGTLSDKKDFILCTNSGASTGVDCGIFSLENNIPSLLLSTFIHNNDITNFTDSITSLLTNIHDTYGITIHYACFAGPGVPSAQQDYLEHMRLPYAINAREIAARNNLASAIVVNDFLALSYGINYVDSKKIITLYDTPAEPHGRRVIIGAGAGLGTVSMIWNEKQQAYTSFPAEAGTGDFPALDEFELELSLRMRKMRNFKTVHWAFFVAEPGIEYLYQILQDMNYQHCASDKKYADAMAILGHVHNDACCAKTAELFYSFYARFVYNLAWTTLPFGGIYLVSETASTHPEMLQSLFLPAYFNCVETKRSVLQRMPVYIVKDDASIGLYGIAQYFINEKKELLSSGSFFSEIKTKIEGYWELIKNKTKECWKK